MKTPHLILLAVTAVAVTCEPQRSNNDIIWYPVDEEEGVFVSTFGEKYRTPPTSKWRSHRRARYSEAGRPLPLSYDPSENHDPSFFHDINERRPSPVPKIPPSFHNQRFTVTKRPQEENIQEILNEVFDYNKHPSESEYPAKKPETSSEWGGGQNQVTENQWGGTSGSFITQYPGKRPTVVNQLGSISGLPENQFPVHTGNQWGASVNSYPGNPWLTTSGIQGNRHPVTGNQWVSSGGQIPGGSGNQWGSTSGSRPTNSEWIATPATSNRPSGDSDKLVFPDEISSPKTTTTTLSDGIPTGTTTTMSPCERVCPVTPEFNPVCGSDGTTYTNAGRLKCAQMCGKSVSLAHHGNCGRTTLVTPLVSNNRKEKFRGFW